MPLAPCPSCRRHVRLSSSSCPFCEAPLEPSALRAAPGLPGPLSRSAWVRLAMAAATTTAVACGGAVTEEEPSPDAGAQDDAGNGSGGFGGAQPVYGAPAPVDPDQPVASGGTSSTGGNSGVGGSGGEQMMDAGAAMPLYGAAPAP